MYKRKTEECLGSGSIRFCSFFYSAVIKLVSTPSINWRKFCRIISRFRGPVIHTQGQCKVSVSVCVCVCVCVYGVPKQNTAICG